MGLIDSIKRRKGEKRAHHAQERYDAALAEWKREDDALARYLEDAKGFAGSTKEDEPSISLNLKKDERVFEILQGAVLIEPKRSPGHWQGGYSGVSFRVYKGVRVHTGGTRGTYVQGEEAPTPIDTGTATITDQRIVFEGSKQVREWLYGKLTSEEHSPTLPWTSLPVSNRQKVSGILYDEDHSEQIRFRMALALAHFNGTVPSLVKQIEQEVQAHQAQKPVPPLMPSTPAPAALPKTAEAPAVKPKTCPNGHEVSSDARFCMVCGVPLT
ncbi:MAG TPA: zinc ribbon domain-containing protein [Actinomycetota bacterium]|nr:zinc ribbon domain-containing protein [Actinomycetota bacterium]